MENENIIYNQLEKAYGIHFQDLFSLLMESLYGPEYKPTSTYGNVGDLSVDGVLNGTTAFAVYAPEVYNDTKTIAKLKSDFNGFLKQKEKGKWISVDKYIFIIKRERSGLTSTVLNLLEEFRQTLSYVDIWTMENLKEIEKNLAIKNKTQLLSPFISEFINYMETIIYKDFSVEHFSMDFVITLEDKIEKWNKYKYIISDTVCETFKNCSLVLLQEFCNCVNQEELTLIENDPNYPVCIFKRDTPESVKRQKEIISPRILTIRNNLNYWYQKIRTKDYTL